MAGEELSVALPQEGQRNSNQSWYDIARSYRIENAAQNLSIPERSWNHPTVHAFVEATVDAQDLQLAVTSDETKYSSVALLRYFEDGPTAGRENPLAAKGMNPPIASRYTDADVLLRGVCNILEYGLASTPGDFANYLGSKIDSTARDHRVRVAILPEQERRTPMVPAPITLPGSAWADLNPQQRADLFERYARMYGAKRVAAWRSQPPVKDMEQEQAQFFSTARRLGIPEENLQQPPVREFVTNLQHMEDLLRRLEQGEPPPGAPGLTPSVAERYAMGAHLIAVAKAILEEGFQERTVEPQFVADHLNNALSYFGLQARLS